jgi:regulator of RNase E activity RraA
MNHEHSSKAFFELIRRELYTAVVGDVMDSIGFRHQFLPPQIKPLRNDMIIVGRSMPVLEADVFAEAHDAASNSVMSRPFGLMLQALDDLRPDEVYVCTGASPEYALWGELMSTRAITLGAAGAVVDGYSRDTRGILQLGFPTFFLRRIRARSRPSGKGNRFPCPAGDRWGSP